MDRYVVFIDGIPRGTQYLEFRKLFKDQSKIRRIFLSNRWRKCGFAFAFVEFYSHDVARETIFNVNSSPFRGCRLFAKFANEGQAREEYANRRNVDHGWEKRKIFDLNGDQDRKMNEDLRVWLNRGLRRDDCRTKIKKIRIPIRASEKWILKLRRSLILELVVPVAMEDFGSKLHDLWAGIEMITVVSKRRILVIFESREDCSNARKMGNVLQDAINGIRFWDEAEEYKARDAWLEIRGLPLVALELDSIHKISESVGKPLKIVMGKEMTDLNSGIKVLVETQRLKMIDEVVIIDMGNGWREEILIVEVGEEKKLNDFTIWEVDDPLREERGGFSGDGSISGLLDRKRNFPTISECCKKVSRVGKDCGESEISGSNSNPPERRQKDKDDMELVWPLDADPECFRLRDHCSLEGFHASPLHDSLAVEVREEGRGVCGSEVANQIVENQTETIPADEGLIQSSELQIQEVVQSDINSKVEFDIVMARKLKLPIDHVDRFSDDLRTLNDEHEKLPVIVEMGKGEDPKECPKKGTKKSDKKTKNKDLLKVKKVKGKKKEKENSSFRSKCFQAGLALMEPNDQLN